VRIVLDTNVLLQAISSRSVYYWIWEALRREKLTLCFTTDILLEYEEVLTRKRNAELAALVIEVIVLMPNSVRVEKYYNFGLPTKDPDDQKFTDCAIACGAEYLVTEDKDFNEVRRTPFPTVNVVSPEEFLPIFSK
jgi:uncharacterized protein